MDDLVNEARLDAKAFRENTVYDSEGEPIRLIANAERLEAYADRIEQLQRQLAEAVANEREACAKVADGFRDKWGHAGGFGGHSAGARIIAAAIRERTD